MKNIKKIIPILLTFLVFISVFVVVLIPKSKNNNFNKSGDVFATSISIVNVPRTIEINIHTSIMFSSLPYQLEPSDCNQEVCIAILDNLGKEKSGASFANNQFKANFEGSYYLKFFVANAYNSYEYDTIKIKVVRENTANTKSITPKKISCSIYKNETINLYDLVEFENLDNDSNYFLLDNNKIQDGLFTPKSARTYIINPVIKCNNYEIFTDIQINVKELETINEDNNNIDNKPEIDKISNDNLDNSNNEATNSPLLIEDINFNKINYGQTFYLNLNSPYLFLHLKEQNITSQQIEITSSNLSVASWSLDLPLLIIQLKNKGETTFTLKSLVNSNEIVFHILVI